MHVLVIDTVTARTGSIVQVPPNTNQYNTRYIYEELHIRAVNLVEFWRPHVAASAGFTVTPNNLGLSRL